MTCVWRRRRLTWALACSHERTYLRLTLSFLGAGVPCREVQQLRTTELTLSFLVWAEQTYPRPQGRGTTELTLYLSPVRAGQTYPIFFQCGRANLPYTSPRCRHNPTYPIFFSNLPYTFPQLTLSFFARVSPLVQAHGGGAGAPDLGGLVFASGCVWASPAVDQTSGGGGGARRELTLSFSNLPYTFSRCAT